MKMKGSFSLRAKALSIAILASAALTLCVLAGFNCTFLTVEAMPGKTIASSSGSFLYGLESVNAGLMCDSLVFDRSEAEGGDEMKDLSVLFFNISVAFGAATTILAWTLGLVISPRKCSWYTMAILGSVTAVLQVPMFMISNTEPCLIDPARQKCSLGMGAYFNIASVLLWATMTLWAQFMDPPKWGEDEDGHKRDPITITEIAIPTNDTMPSSSSSGSSNESKPKYKRQKSKNKMTRESDIEVGLNGLINSNHTRQSSPSMQKKKSKQTKPAPLPLVVVDPDDDLSDMSSCPGRSGRKASKNRAKVLT